nr:hypothetical protein [Streptomyces sp. CC228A]
MNVHRRSAGEWSSVRVRRRRTAGRWKKKLSSTPAVTWFTAAASAQTWARTFTGGWSP